MVYRLPARESKSIEYDVGISLLQIQICRFQTKFDMQLKKLRVSTKPYELYQTVDIAEGQVKRLNGFYLRRLLVGRKKDL